MGLIKSNLEPIEDRDLDLEGKLKRGESINFSNPQEAPVFNVEHETAQEISAAEKDATYGQILSKVQTQKNDNEINQAEVASDAQLGAQKMDAQSRVQHLIDIAQQKGVVHAVKVAQHMQDNYVLDKMRDELADDFHDALLAKGMIKEL